MIDFINEHRAIHGGRADLPRLADRPVDVSCPRRPARRSGQAAGTGPARCRCEDRDRPRVRRELPSLRRPEGGGSSAGKGSRSPAGLHQEDRFLLKFLCKPSLLFHRVPHCSRGTLHFSEASPDIVRMGTAAAARARLAGGRCTADLMIGGTLP
jgi:hypothetical protein